MDIPIVWARIVKVYGRIGYPNQFTLVLVELLGEEYRQIIFQVRGILHVGDVLPMEFSERDSARLR